MEPFQLRTIVFHLQEGMSTLLLVTIWNVQNKKMLKLGQERLLNWSCLLPSFIGGASVLNTDRYIGFSIETRLYVQNFTASHFRPV